jgi:hypothetical protein
MTGLSERGTQLAMVSRGPIRYSRQEIATPTRSAMPRRPFPVFVLSVGLAVLVFTAVRPLFAQPAPAPAPDALAALGGPPDPAKFP